MTDKRRIEVLRRQNEKLQERLDDANARIAELEAVADAMQKARDGYEDGIRLANNARAEYEKNNKELKEIIKGIRKDCMEVKKRGRR